MVIVNTPAVNNAEQAWMASATVKCKCSMGSWPHKPEVFKGPAAVGAIFHATALDNRARKMVACKPEHMGRYGGEKGGLKPWTVLTPTRLRAPDFIELDPHDSTSRLTRYRSHLLHLQPLLGSSHDEGM